MPISDGLIEITSISGSPNEGILDSRFSFQKPIRTSRTADKDRYLSVGRVPPIDKDVTDAEVQAAREVLASLLVAMKNHGLYPSTHVICQKSILTMHTRPGSTHILLEVR